MKKALITGITGMDGSYLAEFLLKKGYEIYGLVRRLSTPNIWRIEHIKDRINLIDGDMTDYGSLANAIQKIQPDEVYNLAAQSFVASSWEQPTTTFTINALGCLSLLEAIRKHKPDAKFYQASSSEMFGIAPAPQNENMYFHPRSPYAVSKVAAYYITLNYRESYKIFACNGILFNHESSRRGSEFVTKKITEGVAKIKLGLEKELVLGNLDAMRDWGHSKDYVEAMWLMLQYDEPDDYVIATGKSHSVRDFAIEAFKCVGINNWRDYVKQDSKFMRPVDVPILQGNSSHAERKLGWKPKTSFEELVKEMVEFDLKHYADKVKNENITMQ